MRKSVLALSCLVAAVFGEPPVENGIDGLSSHYGPPSQNGRQTANGYRQGNGNGHSHGNGAPSSQYGVPFGGNGNGNGNGYGADEPANYEFEYDVDAPEFGVKFGHQESRQGDVAVGSYNVLLPDGRVQHVEYEADVNGYKPKVSYEGTATNGNGYARGGPARNGANGNNGGYHQRK